MKFTIHKNLIEKVPLVREGLLILKDFDNSSESKLLMQVIQKAENSLREKKSVDTDWQKSYEKVGIDAEKFLPSHIALSTRVLDGKLLPDINPIVNVINAIQLEKQLPIGAHDMDKMQGNITVGANENQFTFKDRKDGEIKVNEDEIVHADEKEVLTRNWTWRQGTKDLSDSSSKNIVIFINSVNEKDNLEKIAADIVAYLEQHNNKKVNARFGILSAKTPELDTDKMAEFTDRSNELIKPKPLSQDPKLIERILNKATEEVLPTKEALEKLLKSGRRLRIYQGFDPTADTLHIGHSVMMHK